MAGDSGDKDPRRSSGAVPTGRVSRFARVARMASGVAGGMLAEGTRQLRAGKRPRARDMLLTPGNARRVAAVDAGEFVLPIEGPRGKKDLAVEELRARVRQVLSNPAYARNAQRIAAELRACGGASEAARLIENLAELPGR